MGGGGAMGGRRGAAGRWGAGAAAGLLALGNGAEGDAGAEAGLQLLAADWEGRTGAHGGMAWLAGASPHPPGGGAEGCTDGSLSEEKVWPSGGHWVKGDYGLGLGGGSYAPLVGAACGGNCHLAARRWSGVAEKWGDRPVPDASACEALCQATPRCEAFTWRSEGECLLKRLPDPSTAPIAAEISGPPDGSTTEVLSGPRNCSSEWLGFPGNLAVASAAQVAEVPDIGTGVECALPGRVFRGRCGVFEVHGPPEALAYGVTRGWWPEGAQRPLSLGGLVVAEDGSLCRTLCWAETKCAGFTYVPLDGTAYPQHMTSLGFYGNNVMPLCVLSAACPDQGAGSEEGGEKSLEAASGEFVTPPPGLSSVWAGSGGGECVAESKGMLRLPRNTDTCTSGPKPRCRAPHAKGKFVGGGGFVPDFDCFFHTFTPAEALAGLKGKWVVIGGGSNFVAMFTVLVNYLSLEVDTNTHFDGEVGKAALLDVVFDSEGKVVYSLENNCQYWRWGVGHSRGCQYNFWPEDDFDFGPEHEYGADVRAQISSELGQAPAGHTRVTLLVGQYWQNAEVLLSEVSSGDWLQAPGKGRGDPLFWDASERIYTFSVMTWYWVCGVYNLDFCNREGIANIGLEKTLEVYFQDFADFLKVAEPVCSSAKSAGCFVAPTPWGGGDNELMGPAAAALGERLETVKSIDFLDSFTFMSQLAGEVVENHITPIGNLWHVNLILNSALDDDLEIGLKDTGCHQDVSFSPQCTIAQGFSWEDCPLYREHCLVTNKNGTWRDCADWVCAMSREGGCQVFKYSEGTSQVQSLGLQDSCVPEWDIAHPDAVWSWNSMLVPNKCPRLWCGGAWQGVLLAVIFLISALALKAHLDGVGALPELLARAQTSGTTEKIAEGEPVETETGPCSAARPGGGGASGAAGINGDEGPCDSAALSPGDGRDRRDVESSMPPSDREIQMTVRDSPGKKKPPMKKAEHMTALSVVRFLASMHIVVGHLTAAGKLRGTYLASWGFTWVPFFFVLSGFVLTYARLASGKPSAVDMPLTIVWKRTAGIYPMYAATLCMTAAVRMSLGRALPSVLTLLSQTVLMQSFSPYLATGSMAMHCWFLSCLLVYWVLFRWLYLGVLRLNLAGTVSVLVACITLPWLTLAVPAAVGSSADWYLGYRDVIDDPKSFWFIFLKFNPLCYLHVFIFGMVLAKLRQFLKGTRAGIIAFEGEACVTGALGYLGLLWVFLHREIRPDGALLSARLSVLLPLQGMILLGFSGNRSYLSRVLSWRPLRVLGDLSYAQYLLQFVAADVWPSQGCRATCGGQVSWAFFFFLPSAALIFHLVCDRPMRKLWMRRRYVAAVTPCATFVVLLVLHFASRVTRAGPPGPHVLAKPAHQVLAGGTAVDIRLNITCPRCDGHQGLTGARKLINPSIVIDNKRVIFVARAHEALNWTQSGFYSEIPVTEHVTEWRSGIVFGQAPLGNWSGIDPAKWGLPELGRPLPVVSTISEPHLGWEPCERAPHFSLEERILRRTVVTGPEDPKLLVRPSSRMDDSGVTIAFSSIPPDQLAKGATNGLSCHYGDRAKQQMFVVGGDGSRSGSRGTADVPHPRPVPGVRLNCGGTKIDEKNWVAFDYRGGLRFIYSINPHIVLSVREEDGACVKQYSTSFSALAKLQMRRPQLRVRGSGTATLHKGSYYSLFHTKDEAGAYHTFIYRFSAQPPFGIEAVSREPLPLDGHSFASGLVLHPDEGRAIVAYGWANQESRLLSLSLDHLESLLECNTASLAGGGPLQEELGAAAAPAAAIGLPKTCDVCFQNNAHLCTDCELGRKAGGQYFGDGAVGDWSACNVRTCNFCNIQMGCFTPPAEKLGDCQGCVLTQPFTGCRACMSGCLDPDEVLAGKPALHREGSCSDCSICDFCVGGENKCYGDPGRSNALVLSEAAVACVPCRAGGRLASCLGCAPCREADGSGWVTDERPGCEAATIADCEQYCTECVQDLQCYV